MIDFAAIALPEGEWTAPAVISALVGLAVYLLTGKKPTSATSAPESARADLARRLVEQAKAERDAEEAKRFEAAIDEAVKKVSQPK